MTGEADPITLEHLLPSSDHLLSYTLREWASWFGWCRSLLRLRCRCRLLRCWDLFRVSTTGGETNSTNDRQDRNPLHPAHMRSPPGELNRRSEEHTSELQ